MEFSCKSLEYNSFEKLNTIHNINKKQLDNYTLFGYNKEKFTEDLHDYRSLIFYNKNLIAYGPPKSTNYDLFKNNNNNFSENIDVDLFVEGTMIMLYYNNYTTQWETSTRGNIGATCSFFQNSSKKTFRNMFDESCNMSFLDISKLDKSLCYIFVMNHPDNRIVNKCDIPTLHLVKVYKINNNEQEETFDIQVLKELNSIKEMFVNTLVQFPQLDLNDSSNNITYESIEEFVNKSSFQVMGVIIYDKINDVRTKIRNNKYESVRKLRGNQPKLDYRYLELKKNKNINKYLQYFPEHKENFDEYWNKTREFTNDLYKYYVETHITKSKKMDDIPKEFKSHAYNLHQFYLNNLRPNKYSMQKNHVINYVNQLPEAMLLHALNYKKKQPSTLSIKIPEISINDKISIPLAPRNNVNNENFESTQSTPN